MAADRATLKGLLQDLFEIGAVKIGSFKLKSGLMSPIYIDLRVLISSPRILRQISTLMWQRVQAAGPSFSLICGVPYTALPIATSMSLDQNVPLVMRRKEGPKGYGTNKLLEGIFEKGQECLIVEDLVTSGASVLEVYETLSSEGLVARDVVVFLDREQGARKILADKGLRLHSILTMSSILEVFEQEQMIAADKIAEIRAFINGHQILAPPTSTSATVLQGSVPAEPAKPRALSYAQRAELCRNPLGAELLRLMEAKRSNLSVAVDVTNKADLLRIAAAVGPHICILKTHVDVLEDFDADFGTELQRLAAQHNFLIFEDRKFADIGNTVKLQYGGGVYHIADWSHIVNAHVVPGPGIIAGLREVGLPKGRGLLLLAQMSSQGSLATGQYTVEAVKMATENKDFVIGFISKSKVSDDPSFINMSPGIQLQQGGDTLGQQYDTPEAAVANGSDIIIVGRGVYASGDAAEQAKLYQEAGWNAYLKRIS
eukprot:TRINITY_DN4923_c0_g1_i1.p1 TRINITY_DN4923_c0_g1~~TRINITY_DN4923_c0_g1_i1.p1  ORF type:complete len:503 (-),score=121.26 TRINITY_DN4923_c0_g1_i1:183-1640(-)